jgi:hypothetical protein
MTTIEVAEPRRRDVNTPAARVLPPPPLNLADVLTAAVERLEAFLEDVYFNG